MKQHCVCTGVIQIALFSWTYNRRCSATQTRLVTAFPFPIAFRSVQNSKFKMRNNCILKELTNKHNLTENRDQNRMKSWFSLPPVLKEIPFYHSVYLFPSILNEFHTFSTTPPYLNGRVGVLEEEESMLCLYCLICLFKNPKNLNHNAFPVSRSLERGVISQEIGEIPSQQKITQESL